MTEDQANTCKIRVVEQYAACIQSIALVRSHLIAVGDVLVAFGYRLRENPEIGESDSDYPPPHDVTEDIKTLRERLEEKMTLEKDLAAFGLASLIKS